MPLDGKPKRDRQHHSLSKNSSRRVALNEPPRPAIASPNVPPLNRRQATRHHCASVRMSWSSGAAGALTEGSSNCGHQIPRVGRKSLPGSTLERVRRPIAGSILRTGPGRSLPCRPRASPAPYCFLKSTDSTHSHTWMPCSPARVAVAAIVLKPLLDQPGKLVELRSAHRRCASVARRDRKLKHLPHALA